MQKILVLGTILLLGACGGGGGGGGTGTGGDEVPLEPVTETNVASFTMLLNEERSDAGVQAVGLDERLSAASEAHATDMLENGYFDHIGLNGSTPGDRASAAGYNWGYIGENLAKGQKTEAEVIQDWHESKDGHREVMEDPVYEDFGIGRAGDIWVLMMGKER